MPYYDDEDAGISLILLLGLVAWVAWNTRNLWL